MHPYRVIVRTYIWSDDISSISYGPNTLTCQSTGTNDFPRYLLHVPVTILEMKKISHKRGCIYGSVQVHVETPPIQLIKIKLDNKSDKD